MDFHDSPDISHPPVRFGPGPDESVPHSWASRMLTQLAQENARLFGKLLQAAALNEQS